MGSLREQNIFLFYYYFTRVDVKRLTYKVPKAFICPTVPFIINKKIGLKNLYSTLVSYFLV
jgi:hypothetical protein